MPCNRDYFQRIGSIIGAIEASPRKPVTEWRLTYATRLTSTSLLISLKQMERWDFIKRVKLKDNNGHKRRGPHPTFPFRHRRYGEVGSVYEHKSHAIEVTPKGHRFLVLMQEMAALMPTAPWILEN